jgi:hypothetical protein
MRWLGPGLSLIFVFGLAAQAPSAFDLYEQGRDAEKAGHMAAAYLLYSQASALEPNNRSYWQHSQAVRFRAALEAGPKPAAIPETLDISEDGPLPIPAATYQDREEARKPLPPTELDAQKFLHDFDLQGDSKMLFEQVAKTFGLSCMFDTDYQEVPAFRFELAGVNYREALYALQSATASFVVPLTSKMFLVVKDTPQKRIQLEPMVAVSVRLPSAIAPQDFNSMVTAVQQAMTLEKVSFDSQQNTVILRDRISKVLPARALLQDLLLQRGQVVIDMRLIEISRNDMVEYGIDFPSTFSLNPLTTWLQNTFTLPTNLSGVLQFGAGKTLIGLGIMTPTLVATLSDTLGKVLYDAEMPSIENAAATLHVGERYPVATTGYFGPASFSGPNAYVPPPSFNYEDLGLLLKVTSRLHGNQDVTMDVDAEFKLLTGETSNGMPIINNRTIKTNTRMKVGEWAVLSGLLDTNDARTLSGLPVASHVPLLSFLTATHQRTTLHDQVLLLLRPRIQALPASEFPTRTYSIGSDTRPLIPL